MTSSCFTGMAEWAQQPVPATRSIQDPEARHTKGWRKLAMPKLRAASRLPWPPWLEAGKQLCLQSYLTPTDLTRLMFHQGRRICIRQVSFQDYLAADWRQAVQELLPRNFSRADCSGLRLRLWGWDRIMGRLIIWFRRRDLQEREWSHKLP